MSEEAKTRRCVRCWVEKPFDVEHFGSLSGTGGPAHHCRDCGIRAESRRRSIKGMTVKNGKGVWTDGEGVWT